MTTDFFSQQEISAIRDLTPGVNNLIHFNNAGASLMTEPVAMAMIEYIEHEMNYGGYETYDHYASQIDSVYDVIAGYLGCDPSEIAITENATVAWGQAFLSIPFQKGDIILTSISEYASNYIGFLQMKKRIGVDIQLIPNDHFGQVDVSKLANMITDKVKLIAITHVPTNGGLVNPAEAIGKIAKDHDVWYLLDACQSAGQMPLNVNELNCDFLAATSRKYIRGPRGVGFLYVSSDRLARIEPMVMDLHAASWKDTDSYQPREDARKFENWESNMAGILGLAKAVDYLSYLGIDRIWGRIQSLADYLRHGLDSIQTVAVQDLGEIKCGIVSFTADQNAHQLKNKLNAEGCNVSVISPAHTLNDMQNRGLGFMIRASVHYYNTKEEIDQFIQRLEKVLENR